MDEFEEEEERRRRCRRLRFPMSSLRGGGRCGNRASVGSFCLFLSFVSRADHLMSLCSVYDG
jgi:hypothetical protein